MWQPTSVPTVDVHVHARHRPQRWRRCLKTLLSVIGMNQATLFIHEPGPRAFRRAMTRFLMPLSVGEVISTIGGRLNTTFLGGRAGVVGTHVPIPAILLLLAGVSQRRRRDL